MQTYNHDKELIKDFLRWASNNHKCAIVQFPDEFAANSYVNYRFVNVTELIEEYLKYNEKE